MIHRLFIGILFIALTPVTIAATTGLDQVSQSVKETFGSQVKAMAVQMGLSDFEYEIQLSNLDSRLKLSLCPQPLSMEMPDTIKFGRSQVKVSCDAQQGWALNVPLNIKFMTDVVILNQPLSKGTALNYDHLDFKRVNLGQLRNGYYLRKASLIGKQTKRALSGHTVLNSHIVLPALMIHKGDRVVIMAKKGSMSVKMPGEALNNGREGKQIRVKNIRSNRIIRAKVMDFGLVVVNF